MLAMGYEKTGLGRRVALFMVQWLGQRTLGLGYAVTLADLILAPFTPSNTARSGGTIFPVIRNIPGLYGSEPGETARKIGSYIYYVDSISRYLHHQFHVPRRPSTQPVGCGPS